MKYIVTRIVKESREIEISDDQTYLNHFAVAMERATDFDGQNHWEPERISYTVEEANRGLS